MSEQNTDAPAANLVAPDTEKTISKVSSQFHAEPPSYGHGGKTLQENNEKQTTDQITGYPEREPLAGLERKEGIGNLKFLKGDFTENSIAQWALPVDFSVWQKVGAHVIEVLDEGEDGQPIIPEYKPGTYTNRGLFIFVVREGHQKHDRNRAWDAYEADPELRHFEQPRRWLGTWARFAAVTPMIDGEGEGEQLPHWK